LFPISSSARATNALRWHASSDFSRMPTTKTLCDLSSVNVAKYLNWSVTAWRVGHRCPRRCGRGRSPRVSVSLGMSDRVYLPFRQGSQGCDGVAIPVRSIPRTRLHLSMQRIASLCKFTCSCRAASRSARSLTVAHSCPTFFTIALDCASRASISKRQGRRCWGWD
jgi:hypothetical protein